MVVHDGEGYGGGMAVFGHIGYRSHFVFHSDVFVHRYDGTDQIGGIAQLGQFATNLIGEAFVVGRITDDLSVKDLSSLASHFKLLFEPYDISFNIFFHGIAPKKWDTVPHRYGPHGVDKRKCRTSLRMRVMFNGRTQDR